MTYGNTDNLDDCSAPIDHRASMAVNLWDVPTPQHVELLPSKMTPKGPWRVVCWTCYRKIETTNITDAVVFRVRHDRACADLGIVCRHTIVKISWRSHHGLLLLRCARNDCAVQIASWLAPGAPQL